MPNNRLVIISNESIFNDNDTFGCDNIDLKSIPEGLSKSLDVLLIARKSSIKKSFNINLSKIKISSNIITFLCKIFKTFRMKSSNYLLISITPYSKTFALKYATSNPTSNTGIQHSVAPISIRLFIVADRSSRCRYLSNTAFKKTGKRPTEQAKIKISKP